MQSLVRDKESLELQVSVLTEQVDAQGEKIAELEHQLHTKTRALADTEERLQKVA